MTPKNKKEKELDELLKWLKKNKLQNLRKALLQTVYFQQIKNP